VCYRQIGAVPVQPRKCLLGLDKNFDIDMWVDPADQLDQMFTPG
jgi:hypothetical protein